MKSSSRLILCILLCCCAVPAAWAGDGSAKVDTAAIQQAIDAGNVQYMETWKKGDAAAHAALYTDDAAKFGPRGITQGREKITAAMDRVFKAAPMQAGSIKTLGLWVIDDLAYETGKYIFTLGEPGKAETDSGHYVTIWKRQHNGSWKIFRDMGVPEN